MNEKFQIGRSIYFFALFLLCIGLVFIFIKAGIMQNLSMFSENMNTEITSIDIKDTEKDKVPTYALIQNEQITQEKALIAQLVKNLETIKKEVVILNHNDELNKLETYEAVIIATEDLEAILQWPTVMQYVENGGKLLFAIRPAPSSNLLVNQRTFGIIEVGNFIETTGLNWQVALLDDSSKRHYESKAFVNSSLSMRLHKDAQLLVNSSDEVPLLWHYANTKGEIVFFNGSMLSDANFSAIFLYGLSMLSDEFIIPMINSKITVLQGFPFPLPSTTSPIMEQAGFKSANDFYAQLWWPEMQKLEAKFDLNYTAAFLNTNDLFTPYQTGDISQVQEDLASFGKEIISTGGEISFQSNNYSPLSKESHQTVEVILEDAKNRIAHALPKMTLSTLASTNEVADSLPFYKNLLQQDTDISTVVLPNVEIETIDKQAILSTYGEGYGDEDMYWYALNKLYSQGYFGQYYSPISFLKSKKNIDTLFNEANALQSFIKDNGSTIKNRTARQSIPFVQAYQDAILIQKNTSKGVHFTSSLKTDEQQYYFKTTKKITFTKGCTIEKINNQLYVINAQQSSFEIGLEGD